MEGNKSLQSRMINARWRRFLVVFLALSLVLSMLYMRSEIALLNETLVEIGKNVAMKESSSLKTEADQLHLFKIQKEVVEEISSSVTPTQPKLSKEAVCNTLGTIFCTMSNEEEIDRAVVDMLPISKLNSSCLVNHDEIDQKCQEPQMETTADWKSTVATQPKPSQVAKKGLEEVEYLVRNDVNVNCKNYFNGFTSLHDSAVNDHLEVAKYLLQQGADTKCKDAFGYTPLHWSAYNGHLEVVKLLLQQGADMTIENMNGQTPYDVAGESLFVTVSEDVKWQLKKLLRVDV